MSRQFWTEFLELYISYPCLWKANDDGYRNRHCRAAAMKVLLKKLHEVEPLANIKDLAKKINSYRTTFRQVYKKYTMSRKSKTSTGDVEEPKLWYYYILLPTVISQGKARLSSDMDEVDDNDDIDISEPEAQHDTDISTVATRPTTTTSQKCKVQNNSLAMPKRQKVLQDVFDVACDVMASPKQHVPPNRFSFVASNVAAILEELNNSDQTQCIIAEKLVNDVLFQARLGQLTFDTTISDMPQNN